jgi:hypothetical protein
MAEKRTSAASDCGWDEDTRNEAVAYRAAHEMTLVKRNHGMGGAITSAAEGEQSVGMSAASLPDTYADLAQTHYGIHLAGMIMGQIVSIGVTE